MNRRRFKENKTGVRGGRMLETHRQMSRLGMQRRQRCRASRKALPTLSGLLVKSSSETMTAEQAMRESHASLL